MGAVSTRLAGVELLHGQGAAIGSLDAAWHIRLGKATD